MQIYSSATQEQITDGAVILEEIQERQAQLAERERENKSNDMWRTLAVVGAYILIKAVTNAIKIKDFVVGLTGNRRVENGNGAMNGNAQYRSNIIPLM